MSNKEYARLALLLLLIISPSIVVLRVPPGLAQDTFKEARLVYVLDCVKFYIKETEDSDWRKVGVRTHFEYSLTGTNPKAGETFEYTVKVDVFPADSFEVLITRSESGEPDIQVLEEQEQLFFVTFNVSAQKVSGKKSYPVIMSYANMVFNPDRNWRSLYLQVIGGYDKRWRTDQTVSFPLPGNAIARTEHSSTKSYVEDVIEYYFERRGKAPDYIYFAIHLFSSSYASHPLKNLKPDAVAFHVYFRLEPTLSIVKGGDDVRIVENHPEPGTLTPGSKVSFSLLVDYTLSSHKETNLIMDILVVCIDEKGEEKKYYLENGYADSKMVTAGSGRERLEHSITVPDKFKGMAVKGIIVIVYLQNPEYREGSMMNWYLDLDFIEYSVGKPKISISLTLSSDKVVAESKEAIEVTVRVSENGKPARNVEVGVIILNPNEWLGNFQIVINGIKRGAAASLLTDEGGVARFKLLAPAINTEEYLSRFSIYGKPPFPATQTLKVYVGTESVERELHVLQPRMAFIRAVKLAKGPHGLLTEAKPAANVEIRLLELKSKALIKTVKTNTDGLAILTLGDKNVKVEALDPATGVKRTCRISKKVKVKHLLFILSTDKEYIQSLRDRVRAFLSWVSPSDLDKIADVTIKYGSSTQHVTTWWRWKAHIEIKKDDLEKALSGDREALADFEESIFHEWGHHVNWVLRGSTIESSVETPFTPAEGTDIWDAEQVAFEEGTADLFAHLLLLSNLNLFKTEKGMYRQYTDILMGKKNAVREAISKYMVHGNYLSGTVVAFVQDLYGHEYVASHPDEVYKDFIKTMRRCGGTRLRDFILEKERQAKASGNIDLLRKIELLVEGYSIDLSFMIFQEYHIRGLGWGERNPFEAKVQLIRGGKKYPVIPGIILQPGDTLVIPKGVKLVLTVRMQNGKIGIYLVNGGSFKGGRITIKKELTIDNVAVYVRRAPIEVRDPRGGRRIRIEPTSTEYLIVETGGDLEINALNGSIRMYDHNGSLILTLKEGYKVDFKGWSTVSKPSKIDYSKLDRWWVKAEANMIGFIAEDIEEEETYQLLDYIRIVNIEPKSGTELITEKTYTFKLTVNYSFTSADRGYIGLVAKINDPKNPSIARKKIPIYGCKIADVRDFTLNVDIPSDAERLYIAVLLLKDNQTSTKIYDMVEYPVKKGGCLIATATFGSEISPEVNFLRSFRDQEVLTTFAGRCFMEVFNDFYYSWSPYVADYIRKNAGVRAAFRLLLYPLIMILHLSSLTYHCLSFFPEAAILAAGYVASSLIGLVYLGLPLSLIKCFRRMKRHILKTWIYSLLLTLIPIVLAEATHSTQLMEAATAIFVLLNIGFSSILTGTSVAKGASILPQIIKKKKDREISLS